MKQSRCLLITLGILFLVAQAAGQPYQYRVHSYYDPGKPEIDQDHRYSIIRVDLRSGSVDTVLSRIGSLRSMRVNLDESLTFLEYEGTLEIRDGQTFSVLSSLAFSPAYTVEGILDAPKTNRVFISFEEDREPPHGQRYTLVAQRSTWAVQDSISHFRVVENADGSPGNQFFSSDGQFIYTLDTRNNLGIRFMVRDATNGNQISPKLCGSPVRIQLGPSLDAGKDGHAVVGYDYRGQNDFGDLRYALCNVDMGEVISVIHFPWRSKAALSGDGNKVIIEEVPWTGVLGSPEFHSGRFCVFDFQSGRLLSRFSLPPGGRFLFYEDYPDEAFYVGPDQTQPTVMNLNEMSSDLGFVDSLIFELHQAYNNSLASNGAFLSELEGYLQQARSYLLSTDSVDCATQLATFKQRVDEEYRDSLDGDNNSITREAWKRLYFDSQFIIDRLPIIPLPSGTDFLPSDLLSVRVWFTSERQVDGLLFTYTFENAKTSEQSIVKINLPHISSVTSTRQPPDWYFLSERFGEKGGYWLLPPRPPFSENPGLSMIKPDSSLNGFKIETHGLPKIASYFVQGNRKSPSDNDPSISNSEYLQDLYSNSFAGLTIGPSDPPSPFIHIAFVDSLLSATRQSADLGWLGKDAKGVGRDEDCDEDERPDDGVTKNIEKRLEKAQKELSKGDSTKARKELEKLVKKLERIWKRSQEQEKKHKQAKKEKRDDLIMTSEAYALLKYNTEYLIDRLPEKERKPRKGKD